ncbi:hypothetical protein EJ02DRAFT_105996 [Clathrospora elynae]|uniref:Zn(2)-C6 fungal-type domain-containing protein n=1 Tax=Clathrospora elynae TaxID=706981 RepID=A0A6A5S7K5_9PLEO|nr:hypothetical protein EJ02DRAFT_105996 [Clathrospora elynae]
MDTLRSAIRHRALQEELDCSDRVTGWLEDLDINGADGDASKAGVDYDRERKKSEPLTPPRRLFMTPVVVNNEISPTNTSFSNTSIFDRPPRRSFIHGGLRPKFKIQDNSSDTTSVGDEECAPDLKEERHLERPAALLFAQRISSPSATLLSHDPPSNVDEDKEEEEEEFDAIAKSSTVPYLPLYDPTVPRIVWVTSCLQCTLAKLPCSRTHPSCSRCKRKGHGDDCLLHRRWFTSEILEPAMETKSGQPILLKIRGEDEAVWNRKVALAEELRVQWLAEQEKKNWVMPDILGLMGGWGGVVLRVLHPWEGLGRMSYAELCIDLDA